MSRPRLTVRARLTLLYTGLFTLCAATAVAVGYALVARPGATGQGSHLYAPPCCQHILHLLHLQTQAAQRQRDLILSHLMEYSLITLAVVTPLAVALGWIAAGRALRPVQLITTAARTASEHDLSARVAPTGPRDELRELAETFDAMLGRLQAAFESQQRFIANASHELRTPLAVMRTTADVVLDDPDATIADLRGMAADIRAMTGHAEHLIGSLLLLARNERGLSVREPTDLAAVAEDVLDTAALDDQRVHTTLDAAVITGDPVLAERLIANLVDNAAKYNLPTGGDIWVSTRTMAGTSELTVANTGPVISPADAGRIFQPFQRLHDRTSQDGFGLGLAIVDSIAAIHGGTATACPRDGGGLTVTVTIPQLTPRPTTPASGNRAARCGTHSLTASKSVGQRQSMV